MTPPDFALVDAHIHQWDPRTTPRATSLLARPLARFPAAYLAIGRAILPATARGFVGKADVVLLPYMPPDHARDSAAFDVDTVVHVEADWTARGLMGPVGETRWVDALDFGAGKQLGAIVAHADLCHPRVDDVLAAHAEASPKLRGIRHMAARHTSSRVLAFSRAADVYTRPEFLRGFERLAGRKLRFDAWCYSERLADVAALARRFPEVPIVLDHLGTPVAAGGPVADVGRTEAERETIRARWRDDLARVAEHPNVWVKLSGLAMPILGFGFHTRPSPPSATELGDRFAPFIDHTLGLFGLERSFFASNFPMDRASTSFEALFTAYLQLAQQHGPAAPRALLRDNALRFYAIEAVEGRTEKAK